MGNTCQRRKSNILLQSSTPDEDLQKNLRERSTSLYSDADHAKELNELMELKQREMFKQREEDTKDYFSHSLLLLTFFFLYVNSQSFNLAGSSSTLGDDQEDVTRKAFVMKGWLKFFTFTPSFYADPIPNKFEYNPSYRAQFAYGKNGSCDDKDKWGFLNVPSDTHFFFTLTKTALYAINARRNDIAKTYKSLELSWLEPVLIGDQNVGYKGGIEDIGNFREGFCFRLKTRTNVIWNICADTLDQKMKWMQSIFDIVQTIKIDYHSSGESMVISKEIKIPFELTAGEAPIAECGDKLAAKNGSKVDGRWVILQDWSQCSQACGGGKQFLQRMCVPPQNGGNNCEGEPLLVKDCNSQPCPMVINSETEAPANPTTIKMQQLSSRPLRYEICVIKEGDLDLGIENQGLALMPKYPVRVILNNKTISIFSMPNYDNVYKSWDLNYVNVKLSAEEPRTCIVLSDMRDPAKRATLCVMPTAVKIGQTIEKFRDEWIDDIMFFRDKCKDTNKYVEESEEIKRKRLDVEIAAKDDKYQRIKDKEHENDQKKLEAKVEKTTKLALEAIEKENKFEQLAIEEELMRQNEEEAKMNKAIDDEQTRQQCLEREIKKKQKMQSMEKQSLELAERANEIQSEAVLQVQSSRKRFKEKMDRLHRQSERKRREAHKSITEIRTRMAGILMNENKIGNQTLCNPKRSEEERKSYCDIQFESDPDRHKDCLATCDDYCYVCCENEFGKNKMNLREKCYHLCDEAFEGKENTEGFWAFVPSDNNLKIKKEQELIKL